jgi:hypothetical protein
MAIGALALALVVPAGLVLASHDFTDVPTGHTFHSQISKLVDSGITAGCGGANYCPEDPVTRGQMAGFLNRGLGVPPAITAWLPSRTWSKGPPSRRRRSAPAAYRVGRASSSSPLRSTHKAIQTIAHARSKCESSTGSSTLSMDAADQAADIDPMQVPEP